MTMAADRYDEADWSAFLDELREIGELDDFECRGKSDGRFMLWWRGEGRDVRMVIKPEGQTWIFEMMTATPPGQGMTKKLAAVIGRFAEKQGVTRFEIPTPVKSFMGAFTAIGFAADENGSLVADPADIAAFTE